VYDSKAGDVIPNRRASPKTKDHTPSDDCPKGLVYDTKVDEVVPELGSKNQIEGENDDEGLYRPKGVVYDSMVKDMIPDDKRRTSQHDTR